MYCGLLMTYLQHGRDIHHEVLHEDGKTLWRISYVDNQGAGVSILVEPNRLGASKLLSVRWGRKIVDPLPYDNIVALDAEAGFRLAAGDIAQLEGVKFCSLLTFESSLQPVIVGENGTKNMVRTRNMSDRVYLFGRLWYSDPQAGEVVVYWTRHTAKGKKFTYDLGEGKLIAWAVSESGKWVDVEERHQKVVERLFQLIVENDERIRPGVTKGRNEGFLSKLIRRQER